MKLKQLGIWLALFSIIGAAYLALDYVKLPYVISTKGIVYPGQEWVLARTSDGNLINSLKDNLHNSVSNYSVTEFQRGDLADFMLLPGVFEQGYVSKGDTVAVIHSQTERGRMIELLGELQRQQKLLSLYQSGEKPQEVQMAYDQMVLAEKEYEMQKKITQRNQAMFDRNHIAQEEYELSVNDYEIARQNLLISQSRYEAITTGAKAEQIEYVQANINAIKSQMEHLQQLMESFTLVSPISGKIVRKQGVDNGFDVILRVADTSHYVLMLPVNVYQLPYLYKGQHVEFLPSTGARALKATITGFDNTAQMLDGRQKIFVIARIDNQDTMLLSNMLVDANILSKPLTAREYLARLFNEVYNN